MKMLVRTYRSATSTHADICIIDIIPSCCQTNITHTRQSTRALNRSAVAPVTEPQAVWLCVTHRTFLPHGSYETVKIDYVNLRLYLSERMYSYIPHTKNNLLALCSKNSKKQHAKQSDSQTQSDFLTKIIDYLTNSLTGDAVDDERTQKQIQSDITHLLQIAHQDSQHMSRGKLETFIKKKTDDETPRSAQDDAKQGYYKHDPSAHKRSKDGDYLASTLGMAEYGASQIQAALQLHMNDVLSLTNRASQQPPSSLASINYQIDDDQ